MEWRWGMSTTGRTGVRSDVGFLFVLLAHGNGTGAPLALVEEDTAFAFDACPSADGPYHYAG
jgi:hypothetical protein